MRRMLFLVVALASLALVAGECVAASESFITFRRDKNFLESGRMQMIQWVNPAAPDTDAVSAGVLLDSCAAGTHTFTADEIAALGASTRGWARTVSVDVESRTGTDADIAAGTITVYGTNVLGATVSEAFTLTNNTANSQQGAVAFHTLTSYTYTAMDDDSVGISIGIGQKLGLWNTLPTDTMILAWNGTSADASAAITPDIDEIEKVVVDFTTDPTGTSDCGVLYWIPPFASSATGVSESNGKY